MSFSSIVGALITAAAAPPLPAAPVHVSLGVSAMVVRHGALRSLPLAHNATAIFVDGSAYDAEIDNGVLVRSTDGRLTLRPNGNRPAVLTITF